MTIPKEDHQNERPVAGQGANQLKKGMEKQQQGQQPDNKQQGGQPVRAGDGDPAKKKTGEF